VDDKKTAVNFLSPFTLVDREGREKIEQLNKWVSRPPSLLEKVFLSRSYRDEPVATVPLLGEVRR